MIQAQFIKWLIILVVLGGGVGGTWLKFKSMSSDLKEAQEQVASLELSNRQLNQQLISATQVKQELTDQLQKAGQERQVIQAQLSASIRKLRAQRPPQECKAAIDWAVEQKADMEWEAGK